MPRRCEEFALRHRAMDARTDILGSARQRLEVDMGGDVGLTGIFRGSAKLWRAMA